MMNLRTSLAAATAMALLTSAAYAGGSNNAYIKQNGEGNSAQIQQSAGSGNKVGRDGAPVLQNGKNNIFEEKQYYSSAPLNNNDIKSGRQIGNSNEFSSWYSNMSSNNVIENVIQSGNGNVMSIVRDGQSGGIIGTVIQGGTGASASATGNDNFLTIYQNGTSNTVDKAEQIGSNNGYSKWGGGYAGWGTYIDQRGSNNKIMKSSVTGNKNSGVNQTGHLIIQDGYGNGQNASIASTIGSNGNFIHVTEKGDSNNFNILQGVSIASTGNSVTVTQTGSYNSANATQFGDRNHLIVTQNGNYNSSTTNFSGNDNGVGTLDGKAGGLVSASGGNLVQGTVLQSQSGSGTNTLTYNVTGNGNLFAFAQLGGGNTISGSVGGGGGSNNNQVAVMQSGSGNTSSFSQAGVGSNNIAISQ